MLHQCLSTESVLNLQSNLSAPKQESKTTQILQYRHPVILFMLFITLALVSLYLPYLKYHWDVKYNLNCDVTDYHTEALIQVAN